MIYNCFVNELPVKKDIDVSTVPVQIFYTTLWKHKDPFYIYEIHDSFLRRCREIITREVPKPIMQEAGDFLKEKENLYVEDEYTYFQLFGFEGMPFLLPKFVIDQLFVLEFCQQYLYWSSFFKEKHK